MARPLCFLLVDDDPTTRTIIKRVLLRDYQCSVDEAENGLEALDLLERNTYSMVVLDLGMPVVDGLETLQAIRSTPKLAQLPVVVLTAEADASRVAQVVKLGISDYVTKPFTPPRLSERLARIIEQAATIEAEQSDAAGGQRRFDTSRPILICDSDGDFRHFIQNVLGARFEFTEAESGAKALTHLIAMPDNERPGIILCGHETGILSGATLVKKLRALPGGSKRMLIAMVPKSARASISGSELYDGVVTRTFIPQAFVEQVDRLLSPPAGLNEFLQRFPEFRFELITSVAQVFGMMFSVEVEPTAILTGFATEETMTAAVSLTSEGATLRLTLTTAFDRRVARRLSAQMVHLPAEEVSEEEITGTAQEIANILGGRLQSRLAEHGVTAQLGLPAVKTGEPYTAPSARDFQAMGVQFSADSETVLFGLRLDWQPATDDELF